MHHLVKRILTHLKSRFGALTLGPIIGALVLALLLATNVAADTTPATYFACVNTRSGTIRMITASGTCLSTETKISWNQVGPAGPQGPTGATGPQGPQGPAGGNQHFTVTLVDGPDVTIPAGIDHEGTSIATCPTGTVAIGGEAGGHGTPTPGAVIASESEGQGSLWAITVKNLSNDTDVIFFTIASCLGLTS